jgi:hypothetical protein
VDGPGGASVLLAMAFGLVYSCVRPVAQRRWLLALMKSADRVPNHAIALEALCSPGLARFPGLTGSSSPLTTLAHPARRRDSRRAGGSYVIGAA